MKFPFSKLIFAYLFAHNAGRETESGSQMRSCIVRLKRLHVITIHHHESKIERLTMRVGVTLSLIHRHMLLGRFSFCTSKSIRIFFTLACADSIDLYKMEFRCLFLYMFALNKIVWLHTAHTRHDTTDTFTVWAEIKWWMICNPADCCLFGSYSMCYTQYAFIDSFHWRKICNILLW